jgi:hypothetical protein
MAPVSPLLRLAVEQVVSDLTVAVCVVPSLFVHATTSPIEAVIGVGSNAKFAIDAVTVPASVDGAHAAPPAAALSEAAGASLAGAEAAGADAAGTDAAGAVAVAPPPQALRISSMAEPRARIVRVMSTSSSMGDRPSSLGDTPRYAGLEQVVS